MYSEWRQILYIQVLHMYTVRVPFTVQVPYTLYMYIYYHRCKTERLAILTFHMNRVIDGACAFRQCRHMYSQWDAKMSTSLLFLCHAHPPPYTSTLAICQF